MAYSFKAKKNVVYGNADNQYLTADLYLPVVDENTKNIEVGDSELFPVVVLIHGGAWQTGSKEMYQDWGQALAKEGYIAMAINYRLAYEGQPSYPAVMDDVSCALNWLVANSEKYHIDVNKIGLIGDSAGAHLASLFALRCSAFSYKICAVVGAYGLYDLIAECESPMSERSESMFKMLLGCPKIGNEDLYISASPSTYVESAANKATFDTSFCLLYGLQDSVVNPNQSIKFEQLLKRFDLDVDLIEIKDRGHFWFNELPSIVGGKVSDYPNNHIYKDLINFLNLKIKNATGPQFSKKRLQAIAASPDIKLY